jgi:hypothetical protein
MVSHISVVALWTFVSLAMATNGKFARGGQYLEHLTHEGEHGRFHNGLSSKMEYSSPNSGETVLQPNPALYAAIAQRVIRGKPLRLAYERRKVLSYESQKGEKQIHSGFGRSVGEKKKPIHGTVQSHGHQFVRPVHILGSVRPSVSTSYPMVSSTLTTGTKKNQPPTTTVVFEQNGSSFTSSSNREPIVSSTMKSTSGLATTSLPESATFDFFNLQWIN